MLIQRFIFPLFACSLFFPVFGSRAFAEEVHDHEGAPEVHGDVFGLDLGEGWLAPPVHSHLSPLGTPLVHSFRLEPAFTHRDLFTDYVYRSGPEGTEHEFEMELEWALSRRLGIVVEIPFRVIDPTDGMRVDGFGDLAISPRALLVECERFLLSFNFEVEIPTGDEGLDLGDGEVKLAPTVSTWIDLGNWWTFNSQIGAEHALESNEWEVLFRFALLHTFGRHKGAVSSHAGEGGHGGHDHLPPGHLSVIFEVDGTVGLSDEESGVVNAEGIVGVNYGLSENVDIRAAYQFPLSTPRELDSGLILGVVSHF